MKNLDNIKDFYRHVEELGKFDFEELAADFANHDIFANPPQGHICTLPFFGEIELFLVAITDTWTDRASIAIDDGKYKYSSRVVFLARITPILEGAGYEIIKYGPFAGMVELSCNQSRHSCLFGHPAERPGRDLNWQRRTPQEFIVELLPRLVKNAISRFYPKELHEYPFDDDTPVEVFVKDTNKIGGYSRRSTGKEAYEVFHHLSDLIYAEEHDNVNITGYIQAGNIRWVIPAFGKDYVCFD